MWKCGSGIFSPAFVVTLGSSICPLPHLHQKTTCAHGAKHRNLADENPQTLNSEP